MLIKVGLRNVLIVGPLKSKLSMFYLSVYHTILKDNTFLNILSRFLLSKIITLFFVLACLTKPSLLRRNDRYVRKQ